MIESLTVQRYEVTQHTVKLPTGNFISVRLLFWVGESDYDIRVALGEGERFALPGILMRKIYRDYPHIYSQMNYRHEIDRIRKELDDAFSQVKN